MLTKTRSIVPLASDQDGLGRLFFQRTPDEDGDGQGPRVSLARDVWSDMGCPKEVTVTVEPGDWLND